MNTKFLQILIATLLLALGIPFTLISSSEVAGFADVWPNYHYILFVLSVSAIVAAFWLLWDLSRFRD